jgi:hypothetical protein
MKFSHMFRGVSYARLSQFNSDTKKTYATWVPRMLTEEVKETVTDWLNGLAADCYDEGIIKLVQCLDKCLNRNGGCAEQ